MRRRLLSKGKKYDNMGMIEVGGGKMKRESGFTLIELLAVIVILAIIALIATPIILNIINDSREKSNQRSVEGLKKATETTIGEIMMDSDYTGSDIVCKLGSNISDSEMSKDGIDKDETYCWDIGAPDGTLKKVTYSGSRVKAKLITFNKETGELGILGAKVGSSSKGYSTYESNSVLDVISNDLVAKTDESIFIDPKNNVRYRGLNPNNYVEFNDESWRIIGIIDGKVKLIRETSIGDYSWDSSAESVNGGYGVNEWSQADLMKLLNPGYDDETIGGSLYWNKESGYCYIDERNITDECDFSGIGLTEEAKKMISESVWYLGGGDDYDLGEKILLNMHELIDMEKGTNVYTPTGGTYYNDGITRTTIWKGYVGLMYPSDYGYAADKNCSQVLNEYDRDDACSKEGNWLAQEDINNRFFEWLLTPYSDNGDSAWFLNPGGQLGVGDNVSILYSVRPVLNLKSDVKITEGTGTKDEPYILQ